MHSSSLDQKLKELLTTAMRSGIIILKSRVVCLASKNTDLEGDFCKASCRSANAERLSTPCLNHRSFLATKNFRRPNRPTSSSQWWTQIDHSTISYKWRGYQQDSRLYLNIPLDSEPALVWTKPSMCFSGHSKCMSTRFRQAIWSYPSSTLLKRTGW